MSEIGPPVNEEQLKQEVKDLQREIKAKYREKEALSAELQAKLEPEWEEVFRYARKRGHIWPDQELLLGGRDKTDAERVEWFAELTSAKAIYRFEHEHIDPLKSKLKEKRAELRKAKKLREAMPKI